MVNVRTCINVHPKKYPWIDFCIVLENEKDIANEKEIIGRAYDEWFLPYNQTDLPIGEYISRKLIDVCIWHKIYFTGNDEE